MISNMHDGETDGHTDILKDGRLNRETLLYCCNDASKKKRKEGRKRKEERRENQVTWDYNIVADGKGEGERSNGENMHFHTFQLDHHGLTDGPRKDRQMDIASYSVACTCPQPKKKRKREREL